MNPAANASPVAIISGGIGDIGHAIALELARRGADIAVGDIVDDARAEPLLQQVRELGRRCRYDRVDVADAPAVYRWIKAVERELGVPNWIIPNAAIATTVNFRDLTPEQWQRELNINLNGAFYMAHAAINRLLHHERPGRVVFVGSWAAHAPHPHIPIYCVAKAGMRMLCKSLALEFAPNGILVNEIAPGYVNAGLSSKVFDQDAELKSQAIDRVPTHQLISADEVARQVGHLCDPANRHMTGSTLLMDGGLSLKYH